MIGMVTGMEPRCLLKLTYQTLTLFVYTREGWGEVDIVHKEQFTCIITTYRAWMIVEENQLYNGRLSTK